MTEFLSGLKQRIGEATAELERQRPDAVARIKALADDVTRHTGSVRQALTERAVATAGLTLRIADDPRAKQALGRLSAGLDAVRQSVAGSASSSATPLSATARPETGSTPDRGFEESDRIKAAIRALDGRDKAGVAAEILGTAGGAAAGAAAAGTVASLAGATTLWGSTTLAAALGGVFVVSTPVGWLVGAAAFAGAAGYGLTKVARSGAQQDRVRQETVERLVQRLETLERVDQVEITLAELSALVTATVAGGLITEAQGQRMVGLVTRGAFPIEVAVERLRKLAVSESVSSSRD